MRAAHILGCPPGTGGLQEARAVGGRDFQNLGHLLGHLARGAQPIGLDFVNGHGGTAGTPRQRFLREVKRFAALLELLAKRACVVHGQLLRHDGTAGRTGCRVRLPVWRALHAWWTRAILPYVERRCKMAYSLT